MTKKIDMAAGVCFAMALLLAWLITSVEIVTYGIPGYYEYEYKKHHVLEDAGIDMEMDELLRVTEEMKAYLRGNREDLHVAAVIGQESREFFNQREIAHMEDVRELFLKGLRIRKISLALALSAAAFIAVHRKKETAYILVRSFWAGCALTAALALTLGLVIVSDFTKYFTIFHQIFFDNDLWLLNPAVDLLINIVPEPFFIDTALYIGLIFAIPPAALAAGAIILIRCRKKGRKPHINKQSEQKR